MALYIVLPAVVPSGPETWRTSAVCLRGIATLSLCEHGISSSTENMALSPWAERKTGLTRTVVEGLAWGGREVPLT